MPAGAFTQARSGTRTSTAGGGRPVVWSEPSAAITETTVASRGTSGLGYSRSPVRCMATSFGPGVARMAPSRGFGDPRRLGAEIGLRSRGVDPLVEEIDAGDTVWRFDTTFLTSNWRCLWGRGCQGILPEPAEHLGHACCSFGADLGDEDEARMISALAATLPPARFEHHAEASCDGIFSDASRVHTRVVDGACIFLNRPGFVGGAGCALHLAAIDADESPIQWKPSVCWQLPIKVDWEPGPDGTEVATVRRWARRDWGEEGDTMA